MNRVVWVSRVPTVAGDRCSDVANPPARLPNPIVVVITIVDSIVPRAADTATGTRTGVLVAIASDPPEIVNTVLDSIPIIGGCVVWGPPAVNSLRLTGA